jgi:transcriptional regulator with XRE-family HTH domain
MTTEPEGDWAAALTKRIGAEVKRLRGKRSAQWLADRTAAIGMGISRPTISELETGKRKTVTVQELLVLAHALNTSPAALVYPGPYDQKTEALPGRSVTEHVALQWFSALAYLPVEPIADDFAQPPPLPQASNAGNMWLRNTRVLRLARDLEAVETARNAVMTRGQFDADRDQIAFYDARIQQLKVDLLAAEERNGDD